MTAGLDIEDPVALERYLRESGRVGDSQRIRSRTLAGGVSNRTVRVEFDSGETWVLKQALEKLRVPVDWFCPPERVEREALGMRVLERVAPPGSITRLVFVDPGRHVVAMEAVAQPHDNWKSLLLAGVVERDHFRQFGELLASIQRAPYEPGFEDRSFFEALRLEPYYAYTAMQVPEAAAFLERLTAGTRATRIGLVHGDFSPKNVLIREGRLVLLDHEVIHWGDPAFDIGFAMAHFLSKARHVPEHRAAMLDGAREFLSKVPRDERRAVDHTLGCLLARVAGRSQLEYLDESERRAQREHVLRLMASAPGDLGAVIDAR
jgi:aminoglycoside phosphotransferase (APT) family kinase protein